MFEWLEQAKAAQRDLPRGIAVQPGPDGKSILFMSDAENKRVQVFVV